MTAPIASSAPPAISSLQHFSYVAPGITVAFLWSSIGILQGIYAKYYGVAITTIATVLLIARIFDAVTDPVIGYWSDRYQDKYGSRKPFVVAGGLLFILSSYFLFVPIDPSRVDASTVVSTLHFLIWFLLFYFSFSLFEIPHLAWATELAASSRAKNKIYTLRFLSNCLGMLCFFLIPLLPIFPSRDFTPDTFRWAAIAAGVLMLSTLYLCVTGTPNGSRVCRLGPIEKETFWALRREILANKPLLLFLFSFSLFCTGSGMFFTLLFILVDSYLQLGHYYAQAVLISLVASVGMLSVWYWLANFAGKKFVLAINAFFYSVAAIIVGFLEPGQAGVVDLSLVMVLIYISAIAAISPSLVSEIVDYGTWKFGKDRSASYFSLYTFAAKAVVAIGGSLGLWIVGWYDFDAAADVQSERAVFGLHLAACWLPAVLMLCSVVAFSLIPMNVHRHGIVRRRLDSRLAYEFK